MPRKLINSIKYAKAGAEHALRTQRNIWIHIFVGLIILMVALWLRVSLTEMAILAVTISIVIMAEMFNTAIEELVNILSPGHRIEAALAKNVAAAAVLTTVVGAVVVGCVIFIPRLIKLI